MPLRSQRDLFEIPGEITYLNCAYMSPLLRAGRVAGQAAIARKSAPWRIAASDFFEESEELRHLFAELISSDADGVALIPSASFGLSLAAANLGIKPGQRVVLLEDQFPSNVYPWMDLAERTGGSVQIVRRPPDFNWTAALLEHIDRQTAIVAVPCCHWTDGSLVDLVQVGERSRAAGAALVVDATQSLGAAPFRVEEVRPDFLVAAAYKWLLGPYSLGFLYASPERRTGRPLDFNWIGREGSEDFSGLAGHRAGFQPGARRYDVGERSNFALLPVALTGLRQIMDWHVEEVAATLQELTAHIEQKTQPLGLQAVPSEYRAAHMIGLRSRTALPPDVSARLMADKVYVSVRGNSIRVSPHLFNTLEDVDRFCSVLAGIV